MRYILVIAIFFSFSLTCLPQSRVDSLITLEQEMVGEDTGRVNLLLEISYLKIRYDLTEALAYGKKSFDMAEKLQYNEGITESCNRIATIHNNFGNFDLAIKYLTKCIPIYEEKDDQSGLVSIYRNIGQLYYELGDYQKSMNYFRLDLASSKALNDDWQLASSMLNMGFLYGILGQYDSAYIFTRAGFDLRMQLGDSTKFPSAYLNMGEYYERLGDHALARENYFVSLAICKKLELKPRLGDSYELLGRSYYNTGDYNLAIRYLDSAFVLAMEGGLINRIRVISKYLNESYKETGNIDQAFKYLEIYDAYDDSIKNMSIDLQLAQLEWERVRELENQVMAGETKRQKLFRNFALIAFALMLIIAAVLYRNYRMKRRSNQLLAEIDQMKSRMFSNISHEFRTPLTLILGPLEEMLQDDLSKKPSAKTLQLMYRNADQLLNLVNQMMDLSKMDAGQLKLELVRGDVIHAVTLMMLAFTSLAEKKNIKYEYQLPEVPMETYYDPDKIEKIVNNLLSNAFKFTREGGSVIVSVSIGTEKKIRPFLPIPVQSPSIEIAVTDTGKGIPKDQLSKVFDRFHQVEGSYELGRAGTGIGLALTRELVDLMHGNITVESILGAGSKFTVTLPLGVEHLGEEEYTLREGVKMPAEKQGEDQPQQQDDVARDVAEGVARDLVEEEKQARKDETGAFPEDKPVLLIVEDHADIRQHIRESMTDYHVVEGENGKEGLDLATEHIPDLVITDLMMPEMDGVELCKKLKTDERTSHIPVIMLTAKASMEERIEGLETGADAYIIKPFNMKELKVRVSNLIVQRKKLRERFTRDVTLGPKDIAVTSADERFLQKIIDIIEENMGDMEFDVTQLSDKVAMSRMQIYRKTKALTNQTPSEFIRTIRLKRAAQLMRDKFGNIAEITYEVGFNHPSYFAKSFRELFGESPSDYMKNH